MRRGSTGIIGYGTPVLFFDGLERGVRQGEAAAFGRFAYWQVAGGF